MKKLRVWASALIAVIVCLMILPDGAALADCRWMSGSSGNDNYVCTSPTDTNGVNTGSGNDTVYVQAGVAVTSPGDAIYTGSGNDRVENRGIVTGGDDGVDMATGTDRLDNYGTIDAFDAAYWCTGGSGLACTVYNYGGARLEADNETVDIYSTTGGTFILENSGTIVSIGQEAVHIHGTTDNRITNRGTIQGPRNTVESAGGAINLTNYGTMYSNGQSAVLGTGRVDTIVNRGTMRSDRDPAIWGSGGNDQISNYGTARSQCTASYKAVIEGGNGNDVITTRGTISDVGSCGASIEGGYGSDTIIVEGGSINDVMNGDDSSGANAGDSDILVFRFTSSDTSAMNAFISRINSQSPRSGSATWNGITYSWRNFESIQVYFNGTRRVMAPGSWAVAFSPDPFGVAAGIAPQQVADLPGRLILG
jgi:hypothetical protein